MSVANGSVKEFLQQPHPQDILPMLFRRTGCLFFTDDAQILAAVLIAVRNKSRWLQTVVPENERDCIKRIQEGWLPWLTIGHRIGPSYDSKYLVLAPFEYTTLRTRVEPKMPQDALDALGEAAQLLVQREGAIYPIKDLLAE